MSYCRFSSDDFQCDVYVYADVMGGFTTHIASKRIIYSKPLPPIVNIKNQKVWMKRQKIINKLINGAKKIPIGLPYDGQTFNDDTALECSERLLNLKKLGYNVPQYAIDRLIQEKINETYNSK